MSFVPAEFIPSAVTDVCTPGCANQCMDVAYQFGLVCLIAGWAFGKLITIVAEYLRKKYVKGDRDAS